MIAADLAALRRSSASPRSSMLRFASDVRRASPLGRWTLRTRLPADLAGLRRRAMLRAPDRRRGVDFVVIGGDRGRRSRAMRGSTRDLDIVFADDAGEPRGPGPRPRRVSTRGSRRRRRRAVRRRRDDPRGTSQLADARRRQLGWLDVHRSSPGVPRYRARCAARARARRARGRSRSWSRRIDDLLAMKRAAGTPAGPRSTSPRCEAIKRRRQP